MPIDLVIDERDSTGTPGSTSGGSGGGKCEGSGGGVATGLPGDSNNNANRNADSTSHTDGASTPEMVRNTNAKPFMCRSFLHDGESVTQKVSRWANCVNFK